jgi:GTPase
MNTTTQPAQQALLITLRTPAMTEEQCENYLNELYSLCLTLGIVPVETAVVPVKQLHPRFLVGSGKAQELSDWAHDIDADCIIFDDTISPSQQRNLEHLSGLCVIDRQELILEIFSEHAHTKEALLQVGLARMEYSLPRLTRAWTHLSRQRGGTRGTRGEGETQLEIDRRVVLKKITKLKRELEKLQSQRSTRRKQRTSIPVPTGALVGYTNAGKSSLLNALTGASAAVEDQLFATLDPTTKKTELPGGTKVLLTDTVGFIRKLPHNLIDAFHSTLEETVVADILIHVLDASNPEVRQHIETTGEVLNELKVGDTPTLLVFNKIDLCTDEFWLNELRRDFPEAVFISIKANIGIDQVIRKIEALLFDSTPQVLFRFPLSRYDLAAEIHRNGKVMREEYQDEFVVIEARVPAKLKYKFAEYLSA